MKGMNRVTLIGIVGKDPELRSTNDGKNVVNFSLATSELWRDKTTGERKESTEWHQCCGFGLMADIIGDNVKKGARLCIEGKLRTDTFDRDGQKHYATKIVVQEVIFLSSRKEDGDHEHDHATKPAGTDDRAPARTPPADFADDEIPF